MRSLPAGPLLTVALLLSACASAPVVALRAEPPGHAWWLRTHFHPRGESLRGIPARALRRTWCAVDELTPALFRALDSADSPTRDPPRYAVPGPVVEGSPTLVVLAAYRDCAGRTGTAMVLISADGKTRRAIAMEELVVPAAYAMLEPARDGRLRVVFCQECDDAVEYAWDRQGKRFVALPGFEDGA